jgi:hypothetical protein
VDSFDIVGMKLSRYDKGMKSKNFGIWQVILPRICTCNSEIMFLESKLAKYQNRVNFFLSMNWHGINKAIYIKVTKIQSFQVVDHILNFVWVDDIDCHQENRIILNLSTLALRYGHDGIFAAEPFVLLSLLCWVDLIWPQRWPNKLFYFPMNA